MDWIDRMNSAVKYIEDNILENPDPQEAAQKANSSTYHFQRMFHMLAGYSFGEYIRNRRLSLAAQDLLTSSLKIIDISFKYGYESPEAFTRAFTRLHGISPRESRKEGIRLKSFAPLSFTLSIKGDTSMDFKIKTMESFMVAGKSIMVTTKDGQNFKDIPAFWKKCYKDGFGEKFWQLARENKEGILSGAIAAVLCYKETDTEEKWSYLAGAETIKEVPGMETITIPSRTWAIFESIGPMPDAIQKVWKRIFSEWFPSSNYEHDRSPELELYPPGDSQSPDYYSEVWIPVVQKK
ncbi:MAG: AraC family transcriptional regulator [Spirochaetales bacterium]|nr:AraC family transcriptional regulator [Spirochaetales bacterium]